MTFILKTLKSWYLETFLPFENTEHPLHAAKPEEPGPEWDDLGTEEFTFSMTNQRTKETVTNTLIPLSDSAQRQMVLELLIGDMLDEGQDLMEIRSQLIRTIEELTES